MHSRPTARVALGVALLAFVVPVAVADPMGGRAAIEEILKQFAAFDQTGLILEAAKTLFWSLATVSLAWTMGMLIVRQDIGELLMELLRFTFFTGVFFWLLVNASTYGGAEGFVIDITHSFLAMSNGDPSDASIRSHAGELLSKGLRVFYIVISDTSHADMADQILSGGIVVLILIACALISAQFVVGLVMAWMLGYASIFLLGFGGARWTSPIAINFYKHVVALGAALLALSFIGTVASEFFAAIEKAFHLRGATRYDFLGIMLAGAVLMMVLSIKVPQLLYTMVTGSPLGLLASTAAVAGHAIVSGGGAALASAANAFPGSGANGGGTGSGSVMDAVQRSGAMGAADSFQVGGTSGSDPFGIARSADPYRRAAGGGSVFSGSQTAASQPAAVDSVVTRSTATSSGTSAPVPALVRASTITATEGTGGNGGSIDGTNSEALQDRGREIPNRPDVAAMPDYEAEMAAISNARADELSEGGTALHAGASPTADAVGQAHDQMGPHSQASGDSGAQSMVHDEGSSTTMSEHGRLADPVESSETRNMDALAASDMQNAHGSLGPEPGGDRTATSLVAEPLTGNHAVVSDGLQTLDDPGLVRNHALQGGDSMETRSDNPASESQVPSLEEGEGVTSPVVGHGTHGLEAPDTSLVRDAFGSHDGASHGTRTETLPEQESHVPGGVTGNGAPDEIASFVSSVPATSPSADVAGMPGASSAQAPTVADDAMQTGAAHLPDIKQEHVDESARKVSRGRQQINETTDTASSSTETVSTQMTTPPVTGAGMAVPPTEQTSAGSTEPVRSKAIARDIAPVTATPVPIAPEQHVSDATASEAPIGSAPPSAEAQPSTAGVTHPEQPEEPK